MGENWGRGATQNRGADGVVRGLAGGKTFAAFKFVVKKLLFVPILLQYQYFTSLFCLGLLCHIRKGQKWFTNLSLYISWWYNLPYHVQVRLKPYPPIIKFLSSTAVKEHRLDWGSSKKNDNGAPAH